MANCWLGIRTIGKRLPLTTAPRRRSQREGKSSSDLPRTMEDEDEAARYMYLNRLEDENKIFKANKRRDLAFRCAAFGIGILGGVGQLLDRPGPATCQIGAPCDDDHNCWRIWPAAALLVVTCGQVLQIVGVFHQTFGRPPAAAPPPAPPPGSSYGAITGSCPTAARLRAACVVT